ncbi:MAG: ribose transport system substrate-binding protein [Pseudonocardiales bacterium]|nr:ribose transport system substrate-binding protein [Pseudonocardiales bacterium]
MKRAMTFAVAAVASGALLTGCTTAQEAPAKHPSDTLSLSPTPTPQGERPALSTTKPTKPVKIAIIAIENNPFFAQVKTGYDAVKPKIEATGGTVDWITAGTEVTVDSVGDAINAAVDDGYNAIAALMPGDGICAYVRQATAKGVLVAAYNGDASCAQSSGALFFLGQDLRAAGAQAGKLMCTATKDLASASKPGVVGVETESFTFQALEERRLGFLDGLMQNCPWVTQFGDGVDYQASTDRVASATRDYLTSTENLVGIYVTGGNPQVTAQTVASAGKTSTVKVIGFDFTAENVAQIKAGNMYAAIGQDPYGQSYDTIVWLYKALVDKQKPSPDYFIPTAAVVGTHANITTVSATK